jgi:hypothetical protein
MKEQQLLELAERCRRMARLCKTPAVARKFDALATDYEEYARVYRVTSIEVEVLDGTEIVPPVAQN